MELLLRLTDDYDWNDFVINFIPDKLINYVVLNCNEIKTLAMDEYLQENTDVDYSAVNILKFALSNMYVGRTALGITLQIDTVLEVPNSNENLLSIVKLIEYGNLEIKGLRILSEAFGYVTKSLPTLVKLYLRTTKGEN